MPSVGVDPAEPLKRNSLEDLTRQPPQTGPGDDPDRSIRRLMQRNHPGPGQSLGSIEFCKPLAVIAIQTVLRPDPEKSCLILEHILHHQVLQTLFLAIELEVVALRRGRDDSSAEQRKNR